MPGPVKIILKPVLCYAVDADLLLCHLAAELLVSRLNTLRRSGLLHLISTLQFFMPSNQVVNHLIITVNYLPPLIIFHSKIRMVGIIQVLYRLERPRKEVQVFESSIL